jgi:hypothetical protein
MAALLLLQRVDGRGRLLLQHHVVLLHGLELGLHQSNCQALSLHQFLGCGVRSPKVCNRLPVQDDRVLVVDGGHLIAMHACRDCRLVDERDLGGPKQLEGVEHFNNPGGDSYAGNPRLIFLGLQSASLDGAEANVDNVAVNHCVVNASRKRRAGEKAENKCIKAIGRMPIGGHLLPDCFAILDCHFAKVVNKPQEYINKDNIWLVDASLLEGGMHLQQEGIKRQGKHQ